MRIGLRYEFTECFVVIFERIRFGVPPPLFFVCGIGFGRCCRFVGFLFKLGVNLRALVRQNAAHVVNLIMRAHTNWNLAIGSSASRRGFLFEGQYDENHFLVLSWAWWRSNWQLNHSRVVIWFGWIIHSKNVDWTFCLPCVVHCSSGQLDGGSFFDVLSGVWWHSKWLFDVLEFTQTIKSGNQIWSGLFFQSFYVLLYKLD